MSGHGLTSENKKIPLPQSSACGDLSAPSPGGERIHPVSTAMAYAVIKTGGKQYRVQQGDKIDVENLNLDEGTILEFSPLLVGEGAEVKVGSPVVDGASVQATVVGNFRGPKGVAFKFKRRKGYHKTKGYRRHLTKLEIESISG